MQDDAIFMCMAMMTIQGNEKPFFSVYAIKTIDGEIYFEWHKIYNYSTTSCRLFSSFFGTVLVMKRIVQLMNDFYGWKLDKVLQTRKLLKKALKAFKILTNF